MEGGGKSLYWGDVILEGLWVDGSWREGILEGEFGIVSSVWSKCLGSSGNSNVEVNMGNLISW